MSARRALTAAVFLTAMATDAAAAARDEPLCKNSGAYEVVIHACDLARSLGDTPVLEQPHGDGTLVLRFFISRPFQPAGILRIDVRSATDATMTVRGRGRVTMREARTLSPAEIASIRQFYAAAPFVDMASANNCDGNATIFIEAAEPARFQTTALCTGHDADIELWGVVDEIMLNKFT